MVRPNPCWVWEKLASIRAWWAQVTLTPEDRRTIVFNKGTWKGLKAKIPKGGQRAPTSTVGVSLLWKKAQKKETKKKISETINRAIPHRSPSSVIEVWSPWRHPSRAISRHHWTITKAKIINPKKKRIIELAWNQNSIPEVIKNPPKALTRGQGDSSTIW